MFCTGFSDAHPLVGIDAVGNGEMVPSYSRDNFEIWWVLLINGVDRSLKSQSEVVAFYAGSFVKHVNCFSRQLPLTFTEQRFSRFLQPILKRLEHLSY